MRVILRKSSLLLALVAASLLALLTTVQTWITFTLTDIAATVSSSGGIGVAGSELSQLTTAMILACVALIAVLAVSGRMARTVFLSLLMLFSVVIMSSVVGVVTQPIAAAQSRLTEISGFTGLATLTNEVQSISLSPWPFVTLALTGLLLLGGAAGLLTHRMWTGGGKRYEVRQRAEETGLKPDRIDAWDELSHGNDPTS